ncbi:MAG: flagellar hook-length control protein FliK [Treponema sp.]
MQAFVNNSEKAALNLILTTQDLSSAPKLDSSQSSQNKANFSEMISAAQKNPENKEIHTGAENNVSDVRTEKKLGEEDCVQSAESFIDEKTKISLKNEERGIKKDKASSDKNAEKSTSKKKISKSVKYSEEKSENSAEISLDKITVLVEQAAQSTKYLNDKQKDSGEAKFDLNEGDLKINPDAEDENISLSENIELQGTDIAALLNASEKTENQSDSDKEFSSGKHNSAAKKISSDKERKITVTDLRSQGQDGEVAASNDKKVSAKSGLKTEIRYDGKNAAEMTLNLADGIQQNLTSSNAQTASASSSTFQAMLSNQLQNNAADFVKAGNIVLKDNDTGQIKLILNPESLGNVKIDLEISDKTLTGRITVASREAFNAFKESSESLRQAFINSGFENAGFELAMAGNGSFGGNLNGREQNDAGKAFAAGKAYAEEPVYADYVADNNAEFAFSATNSINIVA